MATVVDSTCGDAALSIEFKVNLLAPAKGEAIVARGKVVKAGRAVTW